MEIKKIEDAMVEANRFLVSADQAKKTIEAIKREHSKFYPVVSKDVASCKRASLDLTRALAKMRQREQVSTD